MLGLEGSCDSFILWIPPPLHHERGGGQACELEAPAFACARAACWGGAPEFWRPHPALRSSSPQLRSRWRCTLVLHCVMAAALASRRIASPAPNDGVTIPCLRITQATPRSMVLEGGTQVYAKIPNRSTYMNLSERITMNPEICHGKPTIRGL